MAVHRFLISFVTLIACCSPTLADTINSFGRAHGLPVLSQSGKLQAMAARHASSMAARGSMDHDGFYSQRAPPARVQKMWRLAVPPKAAQ